MDKQMQETDRWTDRCKKQTDGQTDARNRQMDKQMQETDRWTNRCKKQTDRQTKLMKGRQIASQKD
jgi:queuine/archaeosine tRNA-ribosyltransferase